jgi:hypothetical protein
MNRAFSTDDFALREFLGRRLTARPLGYIHQSLPSARFLFASGAISALTSRQDRLVAQAPSSLSGRQSRTKLFHVGQPMSDRSC